MAGHIRQEFESFVRAAYGDPHGLGPLQMTALQDAFYSGVLTAHTTRDDLRPEIWAYLSEIRARGVGSKEAADA